jgi:hypothetical protein
VQIRPVEHTYSFGTHAAARRRTAREYLFIARLRTQRSHCPLPPGTKPICWPGLGRSSLPGRSVRTSDVPVSESGDAWGDTGGFAFNAAAK